MNIVETKGNQVFNVPNTPQGREFIKSLRVYLNSTTTIKVRGRAKNRKEKDGSQESQPLPKCDWMAVYMKNGDYEKGRRSGIDTAKYFMERTLRGL